MVGTGSRHTTGRLIGDWFGTPDAVKENMSTIYRGVVKSNHPKLDYMMSPTVKREAPRDSKRLRSEAISVFLELIGRTLPERGATAYFECSDRYSCRTIVRYSGVSTDAIMPTGRTCEGVWTLDPNYRTTEFPETIRVGGPASNYSAK